MHQHLTQKARVQHKEPVPPRQQHAPTLGNQALLAPHREQAEAHTRDTLSPSPSAGGLTPLTPLPVTGAPMQAKKRKNPEDAVDFGSAQPGFQDGEDVGKFWTRNNSSAKQRNPERAGLSDYLKTRFANTKQYGNGLYTPLANADKSVEVPGLNAMRMSSNLQGSLGGNMTNEEIGDLYENLLSGGRMAQLNSMTTRSVENQVELDAYSEADYQVANQRHAQGMMQLKGIYYQNLVRCKNKYGTYGSQMHPDDFLAKAGPEFFDDMSSLQDTEQLLVSAPHLFDENNAEDQEFKHLSDYFNNMYGSLNMYATTGFSPQQGQGFEPNRDMMNYLESTKELTSLPAMEAQIGGPGFDAKQQQSYQKRVRNRMKRGGMANRLFGRFK